MRLVHHHQIPFRRRRLLAAFFAPGHEGKRTKNDLIIEEGIGPGVAGLDRLATVLVKNAHQ